ncbi:hypothetical protein EON73_02150 [bacterium]|nr:MAG: hypothetical protein EON73_02150 [bacterium]
MKLYTDLTLLKIKDQPVVDLLVPFCGQDRKERNPDLNITIGRFDHYEKVGKEIIELTSLEDCDACLLPIRYTQTKNDVVFEQEIEDFSKQTDHSNKKTFVFLGSDVDYFDVKIKNALIFCNTLYQSKRKSNEFAFTFFFEDFISKYYNNQLPVREKPVIPTIGFCGYAPPLAQKFGTYQVKEAFRLGMNYLGIIKKYPSFSVDNLKSAKLDNFSIVALEGNAVELDAIQDAEIFFKAPNQPDALIGKVTGNTNKTTVNFTPTPDLQLINHLKSKQNSFYLKIKGSRIAAGTMKIKINAGFKIEVGL